MREAWKKRWRVTADTAGRKLEKNSIERGRGVGVDLVLQ
jgi:hypothetical protein